MYFFIQKEFSWVLNLKAGFCENGWTKKKVSSLKRLMDCGV